jgi:transketolase
MPCVEIFTAQDPAYQAAVLPAACTRRAAIEAGVTAGWWRLVGSEGTVIGIDSFGCSAPAAAVFAQFGLTTEAVLAKIRAFLPAPCAR